MREYVIMTDSCCDLSEEMARQLELRVLPLSIVIDGREYFNYLDGRDIAPGAFYEKLRAGSLGATSAVSVGAFQEVMGSIAAEGKDILCVSFSSALSATYQSACIAAEEVMRAWPGCTVAVVDSRAASMGQGLLVALAVQEKRKGRSLEEVRAFVEEKKGSICMWFTVDDLHHLKRGGRVSAATALMGTMLSIKPVLHVDEGGFLVNVDKVRGRKAAVHALLEKMEEGVTDPSVAFISHGDCLEEAQALADAIRRRFAACRVVINHVGPVIGNHSGPGTIALFFQGRLR